MLQTIKYPAQTWLAELVYLHWSCKATEQSHQPPLPHGSSFRRTAPVLCPVTWLNATVAWLSRQTEELPPVLGRSHSQVVIWNWCCQREGRKKPMQAVRRSMLLLWNSHFMEGRKAWGLLDNSWIWSLANCTRGTDWCGTPSAPPMKQLRQGCL